MNNFRDALQHLNPSSVISPEDVLVCENLVKGYFSTRTSTEPEDWPTQQGYLSGGRNLRPARRSRWACEEWNDGKLHLKHVGQATAPAVSERSASQMWPEASRAMLRRDFKAAARGYRDAYEKSRGWQLARADGPPDSVPFTPHQQLLLELILQAEVWEMNEVH